ncbi:MAG: molybdenum cofactor guanylyltransferase [Marinobacterium sp.]|nr:molybdenum cofactor guanylyltransferase [Marinobacterium sp.]
MNTADFSLDGVILAGGRATRLGSVDKGLELLGNRALIEWSIAPLRPRVQQLIINCNRNHPRYEALADQVVEDLRDEDNQLRFAGPLHGVLSAMAVSQASHLLVLPCDTPRITPGVLDLLISAATQAPEKITVARSPDGLQPLHVIIPLCYRQQLADWLRLGNAKVRAWYQQHPWQQVFCQDGDAFFNLNSDNERQQLQLLLNL